MVLACLRSASFLMTLTRPWLFWIIARPSYDQQPLIILALLSFLTFHSSVSRNLGKVFIHVYDCNVECRQKLSAQSIPGFHRVIIITTLLQQARFLRFMLKNYIVCDSCGMRSSSFECSSLLYITPTCTSSIQELINLGMEQKLEKSCFRCKKNTLHVESNYILQPPKWLLLLIDLNIKTTILPKTDLPYLWIWLLYLVSINSACGLP